MKCFSAAAILLAADARTTSAASLIHASGEVVEGEYIVTLKADVLTKTAVHDLAARYSTRDSAWTEFKGFSGFSASLSDDQVEELLRNDAVDFIEPNGVVRLPDYFAESADMYNFTRLESDNTESFSNDVTDACPSEQTRSRKQSWGQARVTHETWTGKEKYIHDPQWGLGADIYVVDTGTNCKHNEFSRAKCECGPSFSRGIGGGRDGCADGHAHGTFCASVAAGETYGIAKSAKIIGVKVMSDYGMGSWANFIKGLDWVAKNARRSFRPAVVSISLGGGFNQAVNEAVESLISQGIVVVVAAGNSNNDACTLSPASAESAITVGATTSKDTKAAYSSYGKCLNIWAPGSRITGASNRIGLTKTWSGTSMATPHVAGVAAAIRAQDPKLKAKEVAEIVTATATADVVERPGDESPNLLLHIDCGGGLLP